MKTFRVVVLASGAGSNLQAILDRVHLTPATSEGPVVEVVGVGSDRPAAPALGRARQAGVAIAVFRTADFSTRDERDEAIAGWVDEAGADLIVLAGYMQLLSSSFVDRFRGRILNVHPALLPAFPGLDAIGQAVAHGVKVTGVTVHFVDEGVDTGPIVLQRSVEVPEPPDHPLLEAAIHSVEHELLPRAIGLIAAGKVTERPDGTVQVGA